MWNDGVTSRILDSEAMIMEAADNGEITLTNIDVVLNLPQIIWPEGQIMVKDVELSDTTPYGGAKFLISIQKR